MSENFNLISFILHIDEYLVAITQQYGALTYGILFAIIFAETGLVVTPFLPGDSLLFAAGAIAALGGMNIFVLLTILIVAAIIGDTVNYWIGHFFGQKIVDSPKVPFINRDHIAKAEAFYEKHGGKAIVLARFVPIVRTFAPFVAGIGKMNYGKFLYYNVVGGVVWVLIFALMGYFFGNIPVVKANFELVVVAIIILSVVPMIVEAIKERKHRQAKAA